MKSRGRRFKYVVAIAAVMLIGGAGFVASGGETMIQRYTSLSPIENDDAEGPILHFMHKMLRHLHDHFHPHGPDEKPAELHSYGEKE